MSVFTSYQSPLETQLAALGAHWEAVSGRRLPMDFGDRAVEMRRANELALGDLSALPKLGLKGPGAEAWLGAAGVAVPEEVYGWRPFGADGLIMRVDRQEFFLEAGVGSTEVTLLAEKLGAHGPSVYSVARQDVGLTLSGRRATEVLTQTCSYDFVQRTSAAESLSHEVAVLTRIALVSCTVLRLERGGVSHFRIWCSPTYGGYLWETLFGIVQELGGGPIGVAAYGTVTE